MESNIQSSIESGEEENNELGTPIYVETMGSESHNRVRGYGHGVTPDMVSYASSLASTSNSSRRSSRSLVALMMTENNELRSRNEATDKRLANLEATAQQLENMLAKVQQLENMQQQMFDQLFMMFMQQFQQRPLHSPRTQQLGQSQPPPFAYPFPSGTQQSGQSQPSLAYLYTGQNQQPPLYPMYLMPMQPMSYMQQLPMSYMQQSPYQMPVYRPKMPFPGGFSLGVPTGGFSRMLAGVAFDVDLTRAFGSQGGSQEGSGAHSSSGSNE